MTNIDLSTVMGGQNTSFDQIRQQAQQYCPQTAQKYGSVTPSQVTRPLAQRMGNECLAEMGPFKAMLARGPIQAGIDKAFPQR